MLQKSDALATKPVVLVNVKRSSQQKSIREAASGYWVTKGSKQLQDLLNARVVIAVIANTIRGVFFPENPQREPHTTRQTDNIVHWTLKEAPALSSLIGHPLLEDGTRWSQGNGNAWLLLPDNEFEKLLEKSRQGWLPVGPHKVLLRPDGSLEVWLEEGYELSVHPCGPVASAKIRIQEVVNKMFDTGVLATYGAIAQMLDIGSAQSVAKSIMRNQHISVEAAAHVIPHKFFDGKFWVIPMDDPDWEGRIQRSQVLIDEGFALQQGDNALVEQYMVITDGATLRYSLNI